MNIDQWSADCAWVPNPGLWAKLRKFFILLKDYKKGKRKRVCSRDLMLLENPVIYNTWHFREKVGQHLMQTQSWVNGEVVSVSASKHYVGISSFGSQYSSLLQRRRKSFLQIMCVCVLSHVWLFAAPWTVPRQASLSTGFPRQEYWSRLPFPPPGDLPDPRIELVSLASPSLACGFFTTGTTWESPTNNG